MSVREKGVATVPCGSCGADLPVQEQADGSMAGGTCPKCYPSVEKAEKRPAREKATEIPVLAVVEEESE